MARPQRIAELLSGWSVDPHQASAAQAKAAEDLASALRQAQAVYESFTAKAKAANGELSNSSQTALDGITSLARSFAMLNEQSTQVQVRLAERQASAAKVGIGQHGTERERVKLETMRRRNREDYRGVINPGELLRAVDEAPTLQNESIRLTHKVYRENVAALGLGGAVHPLTDASSASGQRQQTVKSIIELDEKLTVRLEHDETKLVTKLAEMIVPLIEKRTKAVIDQIRKLNQDEAIQEKAKLAQEHLSRRP